MNKTTYTAGNWTRHGFYVFAASDIIGARCPHVADCRPDNGALAVRVISEDECIQNARLIAAAPDLLKALKQTVEDLEYWFKRYGDPEGCNSLMMQEAKKTIKKAEGEI